MEIDKAIQELKYLLDYNFDQEGKPKEAIQMGIHALERQRETFEIIDELCSMTNINSDGKCEGLARSQFDDEPPEMCKQCQKYYLFDESE